MSRTSDLLRLA